MPCAFHLDRSRYDRTLTNPGCQFVNFSEEMLIEYDGRAWCPFHLPLRPGELESKSARLQSRVQRGFAREFNAAVFAAIDRAKQEGGVADLSGVVFAQRVSFERYREEKHSLPPVLFVGAAFHGSAAFDGAAFHGPARFDGATFHGSAAFDGAAFHGPARFDGATFGSAWFNRATFNADAWFDGVTFGDRATFRGATFGNRAVFEGVTFSADAWFDAATFGGLAVFTGATFGGNAWFTGAAFGGNAWFERVAFGGADFSGATGGDVPSEASTFRFVNFRDAEFRGRARFTNRRFLNSADFRVRLFAVAPELHNCALHEDTLFNMEAFHDVESEHAAHAYRKLKLAMGSIRAHAEEGRFYALEQHSLRARADTPLSVKLVSRLYGATADYGQSFTRPLAWLLGLFPLFFVVYCGLLQRPLIETYVEPAASAAMGEREAAAAAATFTAEQMVRPLAVWGERYAQNQEWLHELPREAPWLTFWLRLLATAHSLLTVSFLALFLLALRRRFKLD